MNGSQTHPQPNVWQHRPSPVADLIEKHHSEMRQIWERHAIARHAAETRVDEYRLRRAA